MRLRRAAYVHDPPLSRPVHVSGHQPALRRMLEFVHGRRHAELDLLHSGDLHDGRRLGRKANGLFDQSVFEFVLGLLHQFHDSATIIIGPQHRQECRK